MARSTLDGFQLSRVMDAQAGKLLRGKELKVGFLEGATAGRKGVPAAQVAYINEFGAPRAGIPARPAFRTMIRLQSPKWGKLLAAALQASGNDGKKGLRILGQRIREQLQQSIASWSDPPNAASTIARKHKDTPLKDTKNLMQSPDFQVVE